MAGLRGLKTLLVWAGLLGLARCQSTSETGKPPSITLPTSTSLASPSNTTSQATGQTAPILGTVLNVTPPSITLPTSSSLASPSNTTSQATGQSAPPTATAHTPLNTNASDLASTQTNIPASNSMTQNQTFHSPTTHNPTSPPSTPTSTTSVPVITTGNKTASTCPFRDTYSVKPIKYGFRVDIHCNTSGNYTVRLTEIPSTEENEVIRTLWHQPNNQSSQQDSTHNLTFLKPCTAYKVIMTNDNENCSVGGEDTKQTEAMDEKDIKSDTSKPGYLCYVSDWDFNATIQTNEAEPFYESSMACIQLHETNFCSALTTTFNSHTCEPNSVFNKTTNITSDLFEKSDIDINLRHNNGLPLIMEWENKPEKCGNLNLDYSCNDVISANNVKIPDLEPFTDYKCTGHLKHNNHSTIKNKTIPVRVNCELTVEINAEPKTISTKLSWDTQSKNCERKHVDALIYKCCCRTSNHHSNCSSNSSLRQCEVTGLKAFTAYTCEVHAYYKSEPNVIITTSKHQVKTLSGIPEKVTGIHIEWTQNNGFKVTCEELSQEKWNGPSMHTYHAEINGIKKENKKCEFEFYDLSYSTPYELKMTASNGDHRNHPTVRQIVTRFNDKAAIGVLGFLIFLTSLALIFVLYKIYILQRKKSYSPDESIELIRQSDEENLMNVEPIGAEFLLDAYKRKIADEGRLFLAEFQSIPRIFSSYTVKEAKRTCNQPKNRYVDILPYDYNRVQLTSGNGDTGSDYINASFIDGFKESNKYIAAQGPKDETVADFWRMIWEQQSSIIVMVTRCEEGNRLKCAQYWPSPEREVEIFEEFVVKMNGEDHCPDYIIRRLSLTNKKDKNSEREVTHIQFTSWPDHGVPGEAHLLLKLRRRVNAFKNFFSGPIVIHCSAGVGRTGTYISIDAMMEGLESEGRVDIYGYVVKLRRQRCLMVQVEAQYILIHQALIEHNQFGETETPLAELHSTLGTLKQREPDNEPTLLEVEFQRLPKFKNFRTFNAGITEENKKKNRHSSIIPYDYNRVLVKLEDESSRDSDQDDDEDESSDEEDEESTKYINASHIDGYWCPHSLIAAQDPLPATMADFWQMVHQKKVKTIVMLSECTESDQEFCSTYWGDDKMAFGDMEVEVTATETSSAYTVRSMQISHAKRKDRRQVKQYHFLKWVGGELPEKPQDLTDMIKNIKQTCGYGNSQRERSTPIVVHCNDGSSRSGIFCALWNLLDSAETEKLLDVFQVTKSLRKERQQMISSLEQYQFLYDAVDGAFPVQNGEVKQAAAGASVQIVNEVEQAAEKQVEQASGSTTPDQQKAAESVPLVADTGKEAGVAEPEGGAKESSNPSETTPLEGTTNGPTVTMEV